MSWTEARSPRANVAARQSAVTANCYSRRPVRGLGESFMLRHSCSIASAALAAWVVAAVPVAHAADKVPAAITAAVADKSRPAEDQARDANRKPAEVIAFAGIKKGEHIAELFPGGGYFTRIFAKVVGDNGVVYAITPHPRPDAPAGAPDPAAAVNLIAAENKNVKVVPLDPAK